MIPLLKLRRALLSGFVALGLAAETTWAQQVAAPLPYYRANLAPAALAVGAASGAWLAAELLKARLPHATCAPCDPGGLLGLDRAVIGPERRAVSLVSDASLGLTVAGAGAWLLSARGNADQRRGDAAVFAQTLSLTAALGAWSKVAFHRPRPVRYTDTGLPPEADDGLSFPSGHASLAFAAAAAYASINHRRGITGRGAETALLFSAATATAVLRVAARRHFPTDVAAGAALGVAVGWLVPAVYPLR